MDFILIIDQIIMLFLLLILGYVIKKIKMIDGYFIKSLSGFLLKITLPALIISSMQLKQFSIDLLRDTRILLLLSVIIYTVTIIGAIFIPNILKVSKKDKGVYQFILVFANVGFIGYPVMEAVLGKESIFYGAIYNLPFNFLVYTLGIYYISKGKQNGSKFDLKKFINPGVIAVFIGFALFILPIKLPIPVNKAIKMVGDLTTPLSMIIVGALLTNVNIKKIFTNYRLYIISFYRMIVFPILVYMVFKNWIVDINLLGTPVILSGLPVAVNAAILAEEYDCNAELASQSVFISTLVSLLTIPVIAYILYI